VSSVGGGSVLRVYRCTCLSQGMALNVPGIEAQTARVCCGRGLLAVTVTLLVSWNVPIGQHWWSVSSFVVLVCAALFLL
jgi:hypothetical protein